MQADSAEVVGMPFDEGDFFAHLGGSAEHLEQMRASMLPEATNDPNAVFCIDQLIGWNQQLRSAVMKGFESLR